MSVIDVELLPYIESTVGLTNHNRFERIRKGLDEFNQDTYKKILFNMLTRLKRFIAQHDKEIGECRDQIKKSKNMIIFYQQMHEFGDITKEQMDDIVTAHNQYIDGNKKQIKNIKKLKSLQWNLLDRLFYDLSPYANDNEIAQILNCKVTDVENARKRYLKEDDKEDKGHNFITYLVAIDRPYGYGSDLFFDCFYERAIEEYDNNKKLRESFREQLDDFQRKTGLQGYVIDEYNEDGSIKSMKPYYPPLKLV